MGITKTQQESIDAYLREELKGASLQNFEAALASNELLKKEFIFQQSLAKAARLKTVKEAMAQARINNLLENKKVHPQFETVQNKMNEAKAKNAKYRRIPKIVKRFMVGISAACILFMASLGWTNHLEREVGKELAEVIDATGLEGLVFEDLTAERTVIVETSRASPSSIRQKTQPVGGREDVIKYKLNQVKKAHNEKRFDDVLKLINNLEKQYRYQSDELKTYKEGIIQHNLEQLKIARNEKNFNQVSSFLKKLEKLGYQSDELKDYRKDVIQNELDKIQAAHQEKRFDNAFSLLRNVRTQFQLETHPELMYYEASLYAETENYIKSIEILRKLMNEKSRIGYDARWLAGLLYLKTNEKAKAKKEFEILVQKSQKYKDKAQRKLKKHYLL